MIPIVVYLFCILFLVRLLFARGKGFVYHLTCLFSVGAALFFINTVQLHGYTGFWGPSRVPMGSIHIWGTPPNWLIIGKTFTTFYHGTFLFYISCFLMSLSILRRIGASVANRKNR